MGKSISEIKKEFENSDENSWEKLCGFYEQDSRIGVQNLAARYRKKQAALVQERERLKQMHFMRKSIVSTGASVELTRQEEDHWQVRLWQGQ